MASPGHFFPVFLLSSFLKCPDHVLSIRKPQTKPHACRAARLETPGRKRENRNMYNIIKHPRSSALSYKACVPVPRSDSTPPRGVGFLVLRVDVEIRVIVLDRDALGVLGVGRGASHIQHGGAVDAERLALGRLGRDAFEPDVGKAGKGDVVEAVVVVLHDPVGVGQAELGVSVELEDQRVAAANVGDGAKTARVSYLPRLSFVPMGAAKEAGQEQRQPRRDRSWVG